ncbi:MAG: DUF4202 domain-containing protein [Gammaproteobacteria bacterium]|nr:DUF4202 domain-containing protein [Gammaproteobacteria bacterium]
MYRAGHQPLSASHASTDRLRLTVEAIDAYNQRDPAGREYPHAVDVTAWVNRLTGAPSEALQIAARAHHIGRWEIPRDEFPRNRDGYLEWRRTLARHHAETTAGILDRCGYDTSFIERVSAIIRKEDIKGDADTQTFEDALCLVFMERQLADFRTQVDEKKLARILRRTWNKMSAAGHEEALRLPLSPDTRRFLERTLAAPD